VLPPDFGELKAAKIVEFGGISNYNRTYCSLGCFRVSGAYE
jgi:hypothetical protein